MGVTRFQKKKYGASLICSSKVVSILYLNNGMNGYIKNEQQRYVLRLKQEFGNGIFKV